MPLGVTTCVKCGRKLEEKVMPEIFARLPRIVLGPKRCPALREPTLWECVKIRLGLFDKGLLRCYHYEGHRKLAHLDPGMWWHEASGQLWQTEDELEEYDRWLS
jgi:hypothetical protein